MKARITEPTPDCVLSVGMIVKNEEKYLKDCLTALQPLLNAVPSELVIVDTGSTDRTVEIAESFTDKVYHFEWIGDFAAARNYGLERCIGEWFMFLDADEIFDEDMSDIIKFFSSKHINSNYNIASYKIHNYRIKENKENYAITTFVRIARRHPEMRFIGAIHEYLTFLSPPEYSMKTFVHHWGYVFENKKEEEKKFKRNIKPLLEELDENPNCLRTLGHVIDAYSYKPQGRGYILRALDVINNPDIESHRYAATKPYLAAMRYYLDIEPRKTIDYVNKFVEFAAHDTPALIDTYAYKANAHFNLEEYSAVCEAVEKYSEFCYKFDKGKLDKLAVGFFTLELNHIYQRIRAKSFAANSLACLDKPDEAYIYFEGFCELGDTEQVEKMSDMSFEHLITTLYAIAHKKADFKRITEYYHTVTANEDSGKIEFFNGMLMRLYDDAKQDERAREFEAEASALSDVGFFGLMKVAASDDKSAVQAHIDDMTANFDGKIYAYFGEALYLAMKHDANITAFIDALNHEQLLSVSGKIGGDDFVEIVTRYVLPEEFMGSIRQLYWALIMLERAVLVTEDLDEDESVTLETEQAALFTNFSDVAALYVANAYSSALLDDNDVGILPSLHRFGYYVAVGKTALEDGDVSGCIAAFGKAAKEYPEMKDVVKFLVIRASGVEL
ncbi:MAG: glycosyltransferase family 2 protein [Oscillospiraceae bacterium]|nr:glycosyltransferase family 2 protein [Oscillospiraceae bacterium]